MYFYVFLYLLLAVIFCFVFMHVMHNINDTEMAYGVFTTVEGAKEWFLNAGGSAYWMNYLISTKGKDEFYRRCDHWVYAGLPRRYQADPTIFTPVDGVITEITPAAALDLVAPPPMTVPPPPPPPSPPPPVGVSFPGGVAGGVVEELASAIGGLVGAVSGAASAVPADSVDVPVVLPGLPGIPGVGPVQLPVDVPPDIVPETPQIIPSISQIIPDFGITEAGDRVSREIGQGALLIGLGLIGYALLKRK